MTIFVIYILSCVADVCTWKPIVAPHGMEFVDKEVCEWYVSQMTRKAECRETRGM